MKTIDLIAGICFGLICVLAVIVGILQRRIDLFAIAVITGLISRVSLQEYKKLKRREL